MNELQRRFAKKQLSPQQKQLMVEVAKEHPRPRFKLVSLVGPSFLLVLTALLLLTFTNATPKDTTTAATSDVILSQNYFLNMCNMVLIIGVCLYILKLMKDGQWRLRERWKGFIQRTIGLWIIGLLLAYLTVESIVGSHSYYKEIMFMLLLMMLVTLYVCCPTNIISGRGVLFNKILFTLSIPLLITSFIISWTIDPLDKINATAINFSFPTHINWEPYLLGQIGAWSFIGGIGLLMISMKKYRAVTFVVIFFLINAIPGAVTFVKQTFFADNAAAIHYLQDGRCHYESDMNGNVEFSCSMTLKNRSYEPATFTVEIFEPWESMELSVVEAFNEAGPYTFTLDSRQQQTFIIEDYVQRGHLPLERQQGGGEVSVHVKIFDDESVSYQ